MRNIASTSSLLTQLYFGAASGTAIGCVIALIIPIIQLLARLVFSLCTSSLFDVFTAGMIGGAIGGVLTVVMHSFRPAKISYALLFVIIALCAIITIVFQIYPVQIQRCTTSL